LESPTGYTAGRFPLSPKFRAIRIVLIPGAVGLCAFPKTVYSGAMDKEYEEVKDLYVHYPQPQGICILKIKKVTS